MQDIRYHNESKIPFVWESDVEIIEDDSKDYHFRFHSFIIILDKLKIVEYHAHV